MEEYLAHISADGRVQKLADHLEGTARLAAEFASAFGKEEEGRTLGLYHDIGKYSRAFQKRIRGSGAKVDHSSAGAFELRDPILSHCIAGHHSGLLDTGSAASKDDGTLCARFEKFQRTKSDPSLDYSAYKSEIPHRAARLYRGRGFSDAFLTRMLFSCLVDADFLDTEKFMSPEKERGEFDTLAHMLEKFKEYTASFRPAKSALDEKRCEILDECISKASDGGNLFTLTVPTGGGKTIASLGFALEHALCPSHPKKRVIYVIPYTSVIGQNADVFGKIVGTDNVLEHRSDLDYDDKEEFPEDIAAKHKLATENWDAPLIVTTNVRFFESLFAAKSSACRKLHNIANSVVIFDEAQMFPTEYLRPCVKAIEQLVTGYGVTAVLCTATQPSLNALFGEDVDIKEICAAPEELHEFFKRVTYERAEFDTVEKLAEELDRHAQVLCIVNTRRDAQRTFDMLGAEGRFHLSTLMCPVHRRAALSEIAERLREGKTCKVVSTSLVEAGVDLDFPAVYREHAGLDSVIQAAGRCNRENKRPKGESVVRVFKILDGDRKIPHYIQLPGEITDIIAEEFKEDISSNAAIKEYFDLLHVFKGKEYLDDRKILDENFDPASLDENFDFASIAEKFRIIDRGGRNVFIPLDGAAEKILAEMEGGARNRETLRKASQYMVTVYEPQYIKLRGAGKAEDLDGNISVLTDMSAYDPQKGLLTDIEDGDPIFV